MTELQYLFDHTIGDYLTTFIFIYLIFLLAVSLYERRRFVAFYEYVIIYGKSVTISPSFPSISIPYEYLCELSAKQLNGIMQMNSTSIHAEVPCYAVPFYIKRNSFEVKNGKLIGGIVYFDVEFDVCTSVDVSVELYCGVVRGVFNSLGITKTSKGPSSPASASAAGEEEAYGMLKNDIPLTPIGAVSTSEIDLPGKPQQTARGTENSETIPESAPKSKPKGCYIDETCLLKENQAFFVRKSFLNAERGEGVQVTTMRVTLKQVPLCDSKFYRQLDKGSIKAPAEIGSTGQVNQEIENLLFLFGKATAFTIPFVTILRRSPDVGSNSKGQTRMGKNGAIGTVDFDDSLLFHASFGTCKWDDSKQEYLFSLESSIDYANVPKVYGGQISDMPRSMWLELLDMYGSTTSTSNLNKSSEDDAVDSNSKPQCVVCLSDVAQVCIIPCRHLCMCLDCWNGSDTGENDSAKQQEQQTQEGAATDNANGAADPSERMPVKCSGCPVCRGDINAWLELRDFASGIANKTKTIKTAEM